MWGNIFAGAGLGFQALGIGVGAFQNRKARKSAERMQQKDYERQKEFAQNGLSWRVQDAVKSGLHPLVGAGVQPTSFQPAGYAGDLSSGVGAGMSSFGQSLGNLGLELMTKEDGLEMKNLQLEHSKLQNDLLKKQIAEIGKEKEKTDPYANERDDLKIPELMNKKPNRVDGVDFNSTPFYNITRNPDGSFSMSPSKDLMDLYSEGTITKPNFWLKVWGQQKDIAKRLTEIYRNEKTIGAHEKLIPKLNHDLTIDFIIVPRDYKEKMLPAVTTTGSIWDVYNQKIDLLKKQGKLPTSKNVGLRRYFDNKKFYK